MSALPLLVFDTNLVMDLWLDRDPSALSLLQLAEHKKADLVVPEYVLLEFRGTSLRWLRDERSKLEQQVRSAANGWARSAKLSPGATQIQDGAKLVVAAFEALEAAITVTDAKVRVVARVPPHTETLHFRGDLRFLAGRPPDRPKDGVKDCRIYEAILAVAQDDAGNVRPKFLVTKDNDFDYPELTKELGGLGFTIRKDVGALYGELRAR